MSEMTPREIVQELDKHIIGQDAAKRAVAIALRNRWRRMQVDEPLRAEITPKNILMIGSTGVGKTEIARRLARLAFRETDGGCVVHCQVRVERLDTADHRVFRRNEQFSDVPSETPIDGDAGIDPRRSQVWTPMPRDREREREILALVRQRVGNNK